MPSGCMLTMMSWYVVTTRAAATCTPLTPGSCRWWYCRLSWSGNLVAHGVCCPGCVPSTKRHFLSCCEPSRGLEMESGPKILACASYGVYVPTHSRMRV